VATISFGLYASRTYRDKLNTGHAPTFIGFDEESDFIAEAAWLVRHFGDRRFSFRTNSQTTQAAAARAGYGVALLPRYIVATHEPDLVQVSLAERLPERDVWLLVRRDLKNVPRVRALTDYLVEVILGAAASIARTPKLLSTDDYQQIDIMIVTGHHDCDRSSRFRLCWRRPIARR
jgi:DNA-binding transcriptional LysR family regulator